MQDVTRHAIIRPTDVATIRKLPLMDLIERVAVYLPHSSAVLITFCQLVGPTSTDVDVSTRHSVAVPIIQPPLEDPIRRVVAANTPLTDVVLTDSLRLQNQTLVVVRATLTNLDAALMVLPSLKDLTIKVIFQTNLLWASSKFFFTTV